MGNKKTRVTYQGMNQDIAKSKFQDGLYYSAENMKLTPVEGQSFGVISNAYGNKKALTLPSPVVDPLTAEIKYGDKVLPYTNLEVSEMKQVSGIQIIIGDVPTKDGFILFSTDDNGFDCIWEVEGINTQEGELPYKLLYARDLGFSSEKPIQAVFNYENALIQKVYWVDGDNYLRFLNTKQTIANGYITELIDLDASSINSKSSFKTTQPFVTSGGTGGTHTAGVVQYAYSLYNLNGAETAISPMSNSFPIGKGPFAGGGDVNEVVETIPIVNITSIDEKYTYIKIYSVKYTSYNETPSIQIILDRKIGSYTDFSFTDTGKTNLGNLSRTEFLFLGADPIKPSSIALKDNILFAANNKATAYTLDVDTRAYSYNKKGNFAMLHDSVEYVGKTTDTEGTTEETEVTSDDPFELITVDFSQINLGDITYSGVGFWGDLTIPEYDLGIDLSSLDPANMTDAELQENFPGLYATQLEEDSQLIPFWGKNTLNAAIIADVGKIPKDFDCVNLDFDTYRYKKQGGFITTASEEILRKTLIIGEFVQEVSEVTQSLIKLGTNNFADWQTTKELSVDGQCYSDRLAQYEEFEVAFPLNEFSDGATLTIPSNGTYTFKTDKPSAVSSAGALYISSRKLVITSNINGEKFDTGWLSESTDSIYSAVPDSFTFTDEFVSGEQITMKVVVCYHYNIDSCIFQIAPGQEGVTQNEAFPLGGFPNFAPNTGDVLVYMDGMSFNQGGGVITTTPTNTLDLIEQYGEGLVINDVINNNYDGTISVNLSITLDMRDTEAATYSMFTLYLKKNGVTETAFYLSTWKPGVATTEYTYILDVAPGDTLTLEASSEVSSKAWNVGLTGTIDIYEAESEAATGLEGGTGKYISYTLESIEDTEVNTEVDKFFKDGEVYRVAILFYNSLGQETEAKWIGDFKAPIGNLKGKYNTISITLEDAFVDYIATLPEEDRPVGYTVLRAVRNADDKTIVGQGMLTGMMTQVSHPGKDHPNYTAEVNRDAVNRTQLKSPIPMTRGFFNEKLENGNELGSYSVNNPSTWNGYNPIWPYKHNRLMTAHKSNSTGTVIGEIHQEPYSSDYHTAISWQYNKMMQLHTPEAAFKMPVFTTASDELSIIGVVQRETLQYARQEVNKNTDALIDYGPYTYLANNATTRSFSTLRQNTTAILIGPTLQERSGTYPSRYVGDKDEDELTYQIHTKSVFGPLISNKKSYSIYGKPEVTEVGQGPKYYYNDKAFKYCNNLRTVVTDVYNNSWDEEGLRAAVSGVYSEGNRCMTVVLGNNFLEESQRPALDDIYDDLLNSNNPVGDSWDVELMAEIKRKRAFIYSGAIYGGYSFSARNTTEYTTMGSTFSIDTRKAHVKSPGDTFVQVFKNTRLSKTPGNNYSNMHPVVLETIEYLVESSVNLALRNDFSINDKGLIDPTAEETNNYNRVYSTDSNIKTYIPDNTKIKALKVFPTEVIASKVKIPGEFIDNWVGFRPNEVQYLDGKYGEVQALVSFRDELYTFQDSAIAKLSINPRIQTQGQDGVSIELGTGAVLQDYFYLSTTTGSINKWGIIPTNSGIYYIDAKSKVMNLVEGNQVLAPSETKGMHSFLYNNLDTKDLSIDNPIVDHGISAGVDYINGDIFMTVKKGEDQYTLGFNEKLKTYSSFYSFTPSRYITKGEKLFTVSPNNNEVWEHYDGDYQNYYGTKYESNVTLLINTDDVSAEKVFNSIEFDSEVTLEGVDVANSTIDSIEAWTDYQKSGKIPLIAGKSIKRRLRTWRASIPRNEGSRARLKDKWVFLKLGFNPTEDKKLILHDIIMGYSQQ